MDNHLVRKVSRKIIVKQVLQELIGRKIHSFELKYWKYFDVWYCLDVMHIEKNVYANLIGTLLDIPGKTKDGIKIWLNLVELNIRSKLAPQIGEKNIFLPLRCYTLSRANKLSFCKILSKLKVPKGYSSNIKSLVSLTYLKLYELKVAWTSCAYSKVVTCGNSWYFTQTCKTCNYLICFFFNAICNNTIDSSHLKERQEDVVFTLYL